MRYEAPFRSSTRTTHEREKYPKALACYVQSHIQVALNVQSHSITNTNSHHPHSTQIFSFQRASRNDQHGSF